MKERAEGLSIITDHKLNNELVFLMAPKPDNNFSAAKRPFADAFENGSS